MKALVTGAAGFIGSHLVSALLDRAGNTSCPIEVDGGIDLTTAARIVEAGASILVAGSAIFGTGNPEKATRELRAVALGKTAAALSE